MQYLFAHTSIVYRITAINARKNDKKYVKNATFHKKIRLYLRRDSQRYRQYGKKVWKFTSKSTMIDAADASGKRKQ